MTIAACSLPEFHFQDLIIDSSNLTDIDFGPLQNIRYLKNLTLIHSNLHTLKNTSFSNAKYILDINLSHNNITRWAEPMIETSLFPALPCMFIVFMTDYDYCRLPDQSFYGCSLLQRLSLSHNALSSLRSYQFSRLPSLRHLDLSHNNISSVHDDAFSLIGTRLKSLLLHNNNLKILQPQILMPASKLNVSFMHTSYFRCQM